MAKVNAAHMCRDGHVEIYHNDSSHEMCPLCRCQAALREALDGWENFVGEGDHWDALSNRRISELRKLIDDK
jgi:hypothetical protein